jgi:hypothetical protein
VIIQVNVSWPSPTHLRHLTFVSFIYSLEKLSLMVGGGT